MAGFPHTAISWLCPLILLASVVDGATAESKLRLDVDVRYYYGQWQWGDYEMTPRAGQAGPDVRVHLPGGRWSLGTSYLSGDFSAAGASPLSDPLFRSRKNFAVEDGREPSVTFEDGRRALLLADAAARSLASGQPVEVAA